MPNKKTSGRPAENQSRVSDTKTRPKRVPVGGNRDILTVKGQDPDFKYRWVKDKGETGGRIHKFLQASYEFVDASLSAKLGLGDDFVYDTQDTGSLIRKPAGDGEYLYLMRIANTFYNEDQAAKQIDIDEREIQIVRERNPDSQVDDGQYGRIKLS